MTENQDIKLRFFSHRAITIATYFGGPLAAGYLVRQNYINLGEEENGKYALIIGIISTLLIFAGIFSVPEHIIDKIPNALIPAIYTLIIYFVVEKLQGKQLKEHKNSNGEFYSAWKATGIGAICMAILFVGVFGYAYLAADNFDTKKYDSQLAIFNENEAKALELFNIIEHSQRQELLDFIDSKGIPFWENNIRILNEMDKMDGIYDQLVLQDRILRNYCNLRIEQFQLIRKALISDTKVNEMEMQEIVKKIEEEVAKLKK